MTTQQYTLEQTSAPAEEPITTPQAKTLAWVSGSTDDTLIGELIPAVRRRLEDLTGLQLVTATWKMYLDRFPCAGDVIRPPKRPLASVTSITYVDTAGVSQTWDAADYQVDAVSRPARIAPAYGEAWPQARAQMNAVTITFVAGFGAAAAVPDEIKKRIAQGVKFRYDHRDQTDEDWLDYFLARNWDGWIF